NGSSKLISSERRNFRTIKKFLASNALFRRDSNAVPWKALLPDLLIALTTPPALLPYSAEYAFVRTENSRIASTPIFTPGRCRGCCWPVIHDKAVHAKDVLA